MPDRCFGISSGRAPSTRSRRSIAMPPSEAMLRGIAGSPGRVNAIARVLVGPGGLSDVRRGEILVARGATPELVLAFDRIVGLVTDQGGRSAHAVVVAREWGIPAVVGTQTATA